MYKLDSNSWSKPTMIFSANTGRVMIKDLANDILRELIRFIYTGTKPPFSSSVGALRLVNILIFEIAIK